MSTEATQPPSQTPYPIPNTNANPNPAPHQVEVPAVSTPKRASATAELPPTEVRSKRACAGRNEREGRGQVSEERGSAWERARPVRV